MKMFDWNTLTLPQMVEYLRNKYMFDSSGDAKCIYHLIEFYDKHSANTPVSGRSELLIDFFKWCEKDHLINPTGNYEEVIRRYEKSINSR